MLNNCYGKSSNGQASLSEYSCGAYPPGKYRFCACEFYLNDPVNYPNYAYLQRFCYQPDPPSLTGSCTHPTAVAGYNFAAKGGITL